MDQVDQGRVLADDFRCPTSSLLTDFHIWCSMLGDNQGNPDVDPSRFMTNIVIGMGSDFPDPDGSGPLYSHPSNELRSITLRPGRFTVRDYVILDLPGKGWWDSARDEPPQWGADTRIWQINGEVDPQVESGHSHGTNWLNLAFVFL